MDIFDYTDEFEFLKDYYHLQGKNIEWAVIVITDDDRPQNNCMKPGLIIKDSKVFVNLYDRKLQTSLKLGSYSRKVYPADKEMAGKNGEYTVLVAKDDQTKQMILPASFILDIHRECWYGEWMEDGIMSL